MNARESAGGEAGEPGSWTLSVGTSFPMLVALYLRESAGMHDAGPPTLAPIEPRVHGSEHRHLIADVGGHEALRIEWEAWWHQLIRSHSELTQTPDIPETAQFLGSPALHRVASAHRGAAYSWAEERLREHTHRQARQAATLETEVEAVVRACERTLGRPAQGFTLRLVILPFAEPRAWFAEPDLVLLSHQLPDDPPLLRSYLEPILELLV
ncbi:hypothetical protein [Arthrobacter sp. NPDC090010]|uniref:hypothetical protein n=1 Tax=Arthrobacter sp. NPDC090010 TaxID=3363942 RepID=UPI00380FB5A7